MNDIPPMQPVDSSNVESIGHDAETGDLHVRFKNGSHYVYTDVPADLHSNLVGADSIGSFLGQHIKGKFNHRRLA